MKHTLEPVEVRKREQPRFRPVVIRPEPLLLAGLLHRLRSEARLAGAVRDLPAFRAKLARALHLRDPAVRRRFADEGELADYLQRIAAGASPAAPDLPSHRSA